MTSKQVSHWEYCQFLLASQVNYTQTYFADHSEHLSHDRINRMMRNEQLRPHELREMVRAEVIPSEKGYLLFDDMVLDKRHSFAIEVVRRQWSGNAKAVIKGIGVVTCVYVNPELNRFWVLDFRVFDPERDGRTKLDHMEQMWHTVLYVSDLPFRTVLMDTWYATTKMMKAIAQAGKLYYCPIKANRQVSVAPEQPYARADHLEWTDQQLAQGQRVHLKGFPKGHSQKLFRLALSTQRTEYLVTNDDYQDSADAAHNERAIRWKIEQFHREAKQLTGLEACQCRSQRAQRNHITCAMLVWVRLSQLAHQAHTTIYQLKQGLLDDYMRQQLRNPSLSMLPA